MDPRGLLRAGTPADVSVLVVMSLMSGAGCLGWAAFPSAENAPRALMVVLGVLGIVIALALVVAGPRVSRVGLHVVVAVFITLTAVRVAAAASERGLLLSALGYTWMAVYVAFFLHPRAARAYAALMTVTLGLSLLAAQAPTDVSVWVTISAMVWVAVAILTRLNAGLRAQAHTDGLTGC